jgi:AraC-like DNA-binding protein
MDPLTEVFSSMNIKRALFDRLEVTAPWGLKSTCGHDIKFGLILSGSAVLKVSSQKVSTPLSGGDVFIILDDSEFSIMDKSGSETMDCAEMKNYLVGNTVKLGGGGAQTIFIIGRFEINLLDANPILKILPKFLHLKLNKNRTHSFQSVLELLSLETQQPGLASNSMINKLCEMMFIHSVRVFVDESEGGKQDWLAGLADKQLSETIQLIHKNLDKNWTVESMALSAKMSRSAFAALFKRVIGNSPLEYLTQWRMHKAGQLIRKNDAKLSQIGAAVGYGSESAFTKVFKKEMSMTPSEFRKSIKSES